jgi:hypothetical protein
VFNFSRKPTQPVLVVIDIATSTLCRFVGRRLTHKVQVVGGVSAANTTDIINFRRFPDNSLQYVPEPA